MMDMRKSTTEVKQISYEDFSDHTGIKMATATEWSNLEGIDVYISRNHMNDIMLSLTLSDIMLLRQIFVDFEC